MREEERKRKEEEFNKWKVCFVLYCVGYVCGGGVRSGEGIGGCLEKKVAIAGR